MRTAARAVPTICWRIFGRNAIYCIGIRPYGIMLKRRGYVGTA